MLVLRARAGIKIFLHCSNPSFCAKKKTLYPQWIRGFFLRFGGETGDAQEAEGALRNQSGWKFCFSRVSDCAILALQERTIALRI